MRTELFPSRETLDGGGYSHRWAVILAGGEGNRLRPLTRMIAGDERPKQFCQVIGDETLLDQTRARVHRIIQPKQTMVLVTKAHERFYRDLVRDEHRAQLLVQPLSRGTAPAIAYSLLRVRELDPKGILAILPSDHHFAKDAAFTADLETAFEAAETRPDRVMLLGMTPDHPEVGYGWIEPGAPLGGALPNAVCHVSRFWEKPSLSLASSLMQEGCLWNSFVMIGKIETFLALIERALPQMMRALKPVCGRSDDQAILEAYSAIPSSSFSDDVLSMYPDDLAVLCSTSHGWSDLGEASRVLTVLGGKCDKPHWAEALTAWQGGARDGTGVYG